eukprot:Hpha_TRINITY_DN5294_c0_g1::TRINITY_DN5294_c0_g1_i1::g.116458::m.116458
MLHGGTYFVPNGKRCRRENRRKDKKKHRKQNSLNATTSDRTDGIIFPSFAATTVLQPAAEAKVPRKRGSRKGGGQRDVPVLQMTSMGTRVKETGKDSDRGGKLDPHLQRYATVPAPSSYPPQPLRGLKRRKKKDWLPDSLVVPTDGAEPPAAEGAGDHEEGVDSGAEAASPVSPASLASPAASVRSRGSQRSGYFSGRLPISNVGLAPSAIVARATAQVIQRVQRESRVKAKVAPVVQPESPVLSSSRRVPEAALVADHSGLGRELRELAEDRMRSADVMRSHRRSRAIRHRADQANTSLEPEIMRVKARPRRGLTDPPTVLRWGRTVQTAEPIEYSTDEDDDSIISSSPNTRARTAFAEGYPYRRMWRDGIVNKANRTH